MSMVPATSPELAFGKYVVEHWDEIQAQNRRIAQSIGSFARSYTKPWERIWSGPKVQKAKRVTPGKKKFTPMVMHRSAATGLRKYRKQRSKSRRRGKRTLKKRVAFLEQTTSKATFKYRNIVPHQTTVNVNECAYAFYPAFTDDIIDPALDVLPSTDNAGLKTDKDFSESQSTQGSRKFTINDIYIEFATRNNDLKGVHVDIYWVKAKEKTSNTIITNMDAMDADILRDGGPASTQLLTYPSDYYNLDWKIIKHEKKYLNPGDEMHTFYTKKYHKHDPTIPQVDNTTYMEGDVGVLVRLQGVLAHDSTTTTNVGTADAFIDHYMKTKFTVTWPSEVPYRRIECNSSLASLPTPRTTHLDVERN
jgi:hypothetical protein